MAATATESKQEPPANNDEQPSPQPPTYYITAPPTGLAFGNMGLDGIHVPISDSNKGPSVMVTQPMVVTSASPPDTTLALIMSTLSAALCGFWCGAAGILITWKAKLLVLEKKYEHARHSLRIVWVFLFLALLFGTIIWIFVGALILSRVFRYFW